MRACVRACVSFAAQLCFLSDALVYVVKIIRHFSHLSPDIGVEILADSYMMFSFSLILSRGGGGRFVEGG